MSFVGVDSIRLFAPCRSPQNLGGTGLGTLLRFGLRSKYVPTVDTREAISFTLSIISLYALYLNIEDCPYVFNISILEAMILDRISYFDCLVFLVFLAPQLLLRVNIFELLICVFQALPFFCKDIWFNTFARRPAC